MAKPKKLKVFRTPIGFHDAYVAAPSQKAALEAWGIDVNLFARGAAEEVTEPELMKEPLAKPGVVVKRLRGTEKEQIAALGRARPDRPSPRPPASGRGGEKKGGSRIKSGMTRKRPPRPSRTAVAEAEEELEALEKAQRKDLADLDKKVQELARERRELERRHERERRKAEKALEEARERYMRALEEWKAEA